MIDELLDTAHIQLQTATLRVYVDSLEPFFTLFEPEGEVNDGVLHVSKVWEKKMGYPDFVIDVSPVWKEKCLRIWVTEGYDVNVLNKWIKSFEGK